MTDQARDELLKSLMKRLEELGERQVKTDEKARLIATSIPPKGPSGTWSAGDPKWWIIFIAGLGGAGLFGASAVQYRNPPEPRPEVVQRDQEIKDIQSNILTCQKNVAELQKVVHGMRDRNVAAFEKVGVMFQIEDGAPRMTAIGFTERVKGKSKVFDSLSYYPSLRNAP